MSTLEISRMARGLAMGLAGLSLTLFLACGGPAEEPTVAPEEPAAVEEPAPAPEAAAPEAAGGAEPAAVVKLGDPAKGQAIYATYCGACHGIGGKGDGPAAATLTTKPADHTNGEMMNVRPNEELYKAIKEGGAAVGRSNLMPAWGATLNEEQIGDVVAYVRSLAVPPYQGE